MLKIKSIFVLVVSMGLLCLGGVVAGYSPLFAQEFLEDLPQSKVTRNNQISSRENLGPGGIGVSPDPSSLLSQARLRRPVALVVHDRGGYLFVANRRSGSISVIETDQLQVKAEIEVGRALADLAALSTFDSPDQLLLALDEEAHQLLVLGFSSADRPKVQVLRRLTVSHYPVSVTVSQDRKRGFVASLWSKRLDFIDLSDPLNPRFVNSLELPFAPREQVILPGQKRLVVADSFAGKLAVVDLELEEIERVVDLPVHNIRGLAVTADGSQLLLAQQSINRFAHTSRDDIVWGSLMSNTLASLQLDDLLSPDRNILTSMRTLDLGDLRASSGDPQKVIVAESGEVMVSLGGVGRVGIGRHSWPRLDYVGVSRRPTDMAYGPQGRLFVANTFSDSISIIDIASRKLLAEVSLGPTAPLTVADEGELLFFNANLSLGGWMSCHSCHSDGHTNGGVADTLGDGDYGAPKRVPTLLGVSESGPWAWNGSMRVLSDQIRKSLHTTLRASDVTDKQVEALESFLRKLEPPRLPSNSLTSLVGKGRELFSEYRCIRCHTPPAYTSKGTRDVGLSDTAGNRRFNTPSLRGVSHRPAFFHDGRARNLREVFEVFGHPDPDIAADEISALIAFMSTL